MTGKLKNAVFMRFLYQKQPQNQVIGKLNACYDTFVLSQAHRYYIMSDEVKDMDYSKEIEDIRNELRQLLTKCVDEWWEVFRKEQEEYERTHQRIGKLQMS